MRYIVNIFPVIIEDFDHIFFLEIYHEELNVSVTKVIRELRIALISSGQMPEDLGIGRTLDGNLVIFSYNRHSIQEFFYDKFEALLKNGIIMESILNRLAQFHDFSLKERYRIIYAVVKELENRIFQQMYNRGWIITSGRRIYRRNKSYLLNPDETREIANIYRSLSIKATMLNAVDTDLSRHVIIGLIVDPSLVIEPVITMEQIIKNNIIYPYNAVATNIEIDRIFYKEQRRILWEIEGITKDRIQCVRVRKRGSRWHIEHQEFSLSECFPVPRPEILDLIRDKMGIDGSIIKIIKRASFHITESSKKDRFSAFKRFESTQVLLEELISYLKELKFPEKKIAVEHKPLRLFISE